MISHLEALALARSGRCRRRDGCRGRREIAQRAARRERAGLFEAARAVWEAFYGNAAAARQSASRALALGRGRDVDYAAAFALALSGDLPQSRALAENFAREFPEDTLVQFMYLPTLRALFSLNLTIRQRRFRRCRPPRATISPGRRRLHRTLRRPVPHLRSRPGISRAHVSPPKPPPSSSGFSIIEASCSSIPWTRWRACSWHERSRSRATP